MLKENLFDADQDLKDLQAKKENVMSGIASRHEELNSAINEMQATLNKPADIDINMAFDDMQAKLQHEANMKDLKDIDSALDALLA